MNKKILYTLAVTAVVLPFLGLALALNQRSVEPVPTATPYTNFVSYGRLNNPEYGFSSTLHKDIEPCCPDGVPCADQLRYLSVDCAPGQAATLVAKIRDFVRATFTPTLTTAPTFVATDTPSATPTVEVTPNPTQTGTPSPTQEPTKTPKVTKTPKPTDTPTVEPTKKPHCDKGEGNGGENCDPGNHPEKGNDDEDNGKNKPNNKHD
jgi:outer membrane biosynthesis protein TonB